ncbi:MAG: leucine-rich repeat domain-containing protein [Oscillospiraceae bacterium]|nr:leucine-rich repeat domain-containing protein [Oscillospiraceae bacterium]
MFKANTWGKKFLALLLMAAMVWMLLPAFALPVFAASGWVDGSGEPLELYFNIMSETTAQVTFRLGAAPYMGERNYYYTGDIVIPGTVYNGGKAYQVTSIGDNAFAYAVELNSVVIPEGVEYIDAFAFRSSAVTSVTIPSTVKVLGGSAFQQCGDLTAISIPEALESIGNSCFYSCAKLELSGPVLPATLHTLGNQAFYGCAALKQMTIPEGITAIGDYTFSGCSGLESITVSNHRHGGFRRLRFDLY